MSSPVRSIQKRIMKRKGFQRDYKIVGDKIVPQPYPRFMPKTIIEAQPDDTSGDYTIGSQTNA